MCAAFIPTARKKVEAPVEENRHLTFFIDNTEYALPILKVREIVTLTDITALPDSPPSIKGVVHLRGQMIPVLDVRTRFHLPAGSPARPCIIVVEKEDNKNDGALMGLWVDSVARVVPIPKNSIGQLEARGDHQEYIVGVSHEDRPGEAQPHVIILLEVKKLLENLA